MSKDDSRLYLLMFAIYANICSHSIIQLEIQGVCLCCMMACVGFCILAQHTCV